MDQTSEEHIEADDNLRLSIIKQVAEKVVFDITLQVFERFRTELEPTDSCSNVTCPSIAIVKHCVSLSATQPHDGAFSLHDTFLVKLFQQPQRLHKQKPDPGVTHKTPLTTKQRNKLRKKLQLKKKLKAMASDPPVRNQFLLQYFSHACHGGKM